MAVDPFEGYAPIPGALSRLGRAITDSDGMPSGSPANYEETRGCPHPGGWSVLHIATASFLGEEGMFTALDRQFRDVGTTVEYEDSFRKAETGDDDVPIRTRVRLVRPEEDGEDEDETPRPTRRNRVSEEDEDDAAPQRPSRGTGAKRTTRGER